MDKIYLKKLIKESVKSALNEHSTPMEITPLSDRPLEYYKVEKDDNTVRFIRDDGQIVKLTHSEGANVTVDGLISDIDGEMITSAYVIPYVHKTPEYTDIWPHVKIDHTGGSVDLRWHGPGTLNVFVNGKKWKSATFSLD